MVWLDEEKQSGGELIPGGSSAKRKLAKARSEYTSFLVKQSIHPIIQNINLKRGKSVDGGYLLAGIICVLVLPVILNVVSSDEHFEYSSSKYAV